MILSWLILNICLMLTRAFARIPDSVLQKWIPSHLITSAHGISENPYGSAKL